MKFPVGLRLNGRINNVTDLGVFVDLPHHHHGLIFKKDFGQKWASQRHNYEIGQELRVVIVNNYHGKIALSLAQVNNPDLVDPTNSFNEKEDFQKTLTELVEKANDQISNLKKI